MGTTTIHSKEANPLKNDQQEWIDVSIDENKETITLIWFNPNIDTHDNTKKRLREVNDYFKLYRVNPWRSNHLFGKVFFY